MSIHFVPEPPIELMSATGALAVWGLARIRLALGRAREGDMVSSAAVDPGR